jgi:hypothetical protein
MTLIIISYYVEYLLSIVHWRDDDPGEYHLEHVFATKVERLLAQELGVNWSAYDREVSSK